MNGTGTCLVLGTAKSGTTALLYMVRQAIGTPPICFEEPLASMGELPEGALAKVIFEHETADAIDRFAKLFRTRIMLLRDPRDNIISRMLYAVAARLALLEDDAFLRDFLRALRRKQEQPASVDVGQLLAMLDGRPNGFVEDTLEIGRQLAAFRRQTAADWSVVRYEAMVAGDLASVSAAIGRPVQADPVIDRTYARVVRTRAAGDWRHWFTRRDTARLRVEFEPVMRELGYGDDWEAAETPTIRPEHSWRYVMGLVEERRRLHGLPAFVLSPPPVVRRSQAAPEVACTLCGGRVFGPGPNGRMASNGRPPACLTCGALERQRIVRAVMHALPLGLLSMRHALAFGANAGLQPSWFRSWELAEVADCVSRSDGSADFILLDHVLEYCRDDHAAFGTFMRLLSPGGLLLVIFASSESRAVSEHYVEAAGTPAVWHRYGADLIAHFGCAGKGIAALRLALTDPCTAASGELHLFCRDRRALTQFQRHVWTWDASIVAQVFGEGPAASASSVADAALPPCDVAA